MLAIASAIPLGRTLTDDEVRLSIDWARTRGMPIIMNEVYGLSIHGPTEGINVIIKNIKRAGHGVRSFDNYRLRLLLHAGVDWQTP